MKIKKFLTFTHLTNLSKLLATKQLVKILQQQVSGWLAEDTSGKQGSCRSHLMYLHTLVFEKKCTRLLGWGSYERLYPCKESHQNKILAWQYRQECCPSSLLLFSKPCVSSFRWQRGVHKANLTAWKRWEVFAFTDLSGYQAQLLPTAGSQSKEWMHALPWFNGLHANLSPVMHY